MKPFLQIKPLGRRNKKGARSKFSLGKEVKKEQMRSTLINQRWSVELPGDETLCPSELGQSRPLELQEMQHMMQRIGQIGFGLSAGEH